MTAIITVGNSESMRRCDASCHNAKGVICKCVCGGAFHGAALKGGPIRNLEDAERVTGVKYAPAHEIDAQLRIG